jgi:hypothetical protein
MSHERDTYDQEIIVDFRANAGVPQSVLDRSLQLRHSA